ncbi:conjugal transfer protein TraB [Agrobacterium tumefaciens]|uniref:conjugal transfer protein TraB n=1 Tax=Agrobacterium tumefaciens TaxID=358 RepID=UPI001F438AB8
MIPDRVRGPILIGLSVVVGTVGWSGNIITLPVVTLFPLLWAQSPSRLVAAAVSAGYFLAASRGLPQGVANFYAADLWPGLLLWVVASLAFVVVHAALWQRPEEGRSGKQHRGGGRTVRYLVAMVLSGLPPFGITGWAHPLTTAGVIFPGWGWWGLAGTATSLLTMTTRHWPAAVIALGGFWLWSTASWTDPNLPDGWTGVDLTLGQSLGRDGSLEYHHDLIATVRHAVSTYPGTRLVVLPESVLGLWTPTIERFWRDGLRGSDITVIAGAAVIGREDYDNVMVAISAGDARILYRERMPVPVSMWQPWRQWARQGGGARADFFGNPSVAIDGQKIAPLICYEQLILWPVLQSMLHSPGIIVATGNGWWTEGTSIVAIQNANVTAWGRLFAVPVIMAFNR